MYPNTLEDPENYSLKRTINVGDGRRLEIRVVKVVSNYNIYRIKEWVAIPGGKGRRITKISHRSKELLYMKNNPQIARSQR